MDPMDAYFEDDTGANLSPRDLASIRAPDSLYSYRRDTPTLTRPTVQWRQDHPKPICSGYRPIGPDPRDYFSKPYPYQLARGDNPYAPWVTKETFGSHTDSYQLVLMVILFVVVAMVSFILGGFIGCTFANKFISITPLQKT